MTPAPNEPTFSVIIPCYNHARYLAESIESARAQGGGDDVEVIVVDDGSTDRSVDVTAEYPNVTLVRQPNAGLPAARNAGVRASRGRFLAFLDADDRLLPNALRAGQAVLESAPDAAFAVGSFYYIDAAGHVTSAYPPLAVHGDAYEAMLRQSFIPMHATVLFRREVILEVGGYDESLPACEDFDLYLRILRGHGMRQHDALVAAYRRHDANLSRNAQLVVAAAVRVLGKEWRFVRHDDRLRRAFNDGVRFWVTSSANTTLWPAASGAWYLGGWDALRGAGVLLQHVPVWFLHRMRDHAVNEVRTLAGGVRAMIRRFIGGGRRAEVERLSVVSRHYRLFPPAVGDVDLGDLRRISPVDRDFGFNRGWPIDRYYVDGFMSAHANDVAGRVLEVKDGAYTRRFGGDRVRQLDVVDIDATNPLATIVTDLTTGDGIEDNAYDCVVLTQTLHLLYDMRSAVATIHRVLKAGGVALVTVPGISKVDSSVPWHWSLTVASARRLFEEVFQASEVTVSARGNVLAATAFLQGLSTDELTTAELDVVDAEYPVTVCIRARKEGAVATTGDDTGSR